MVIHTMDVTSLFDNFEVNLENASRLREIDLTDINTSDIYSQMATLLLTTIGKREPYDTMTEEIAIDISATYTDDEYGDWYDVMHELYEDVDGLVSAMNSGDSQLYRASQYESIEAEIVKNGNGHLMVYIGNELFSNGLFLEESSYQYNYTLCVTTECALFERSFNDFITKYLSIHRDRLDSIKTKHIFVGLCELIFPVLHDEHVMDVIDSGMHLSTLDAMFRNNYVVDFKSNTAVTEYINSDTSILDILISTFKKISMSHIEVSSWKIVSDDVYLGLYLKEKGDT